MSLIKNVYYYEYGFRVAYFKTKFNLEGIELGDFYLFFGLRIMEYRPYSCVSNKKSCVYVF
jgi:hypothetical protein